MTTITPEEALKSKKNFEDFMADYYPPIVTSTLASYPKADGQTVVSICDLTQKMETMVSLLNEIESLNLNKAPFIVWYVTSEKEELVTAAKALNHFAIKGIKIFIFKAFLNGDKMGFECLLKPELNDKKSYTRNENTPAKIFQKEYWEKYFEICDELQSEMQVNPKPQHFQYLPMGKRGVQIMQTVNTKLGYVATEIFINNDQTIFEKLLEHKVEIEEELGFLEWQPIEGKKSSRIRKTLGVNILKEGNIERAVKLQIQTAEDFKKVFSKYLV